MRIIVTGGAGFIGSHLCEKLVEMGHEVICIDNFVTGAPKNIAHLLEAAKNGKANFKLIEHDITNPLHELFPNTNYPVPPEYKIDQVYHLACPASPIDYKDLPLQTLWTAVAGTKNVVEIAVKHSAKLLLASTSEVYGDPKIHPQTEDYFGNVNPVGPRSCYSEAKRFAETVAYNFWHHFQYPLRIARIFNTYGPRMRKSDGRVIPEFINRALNFEPLRVHGDGKQTRSFCYVDDLVAGLIALMNTEENYFGPVNLGNPEEITVGELAKMVVEMTGGTAMISNVPAVEEDPVVRKPDISKAKKLFGFEPKISLKEGLKLVIESCQK